jgi:hypothetical protein
MTEMEVSVASQDGELPGWQSLPDWPDNVFVALNETLDV